MSAEKIQSVMESLEKIDKKTNDMIMDIVNSMSSIEIIQSFNQAAFDMFNTTHNLTVKMGIEHEYKIVGYKRLFEQATKINFQKPIDHFTLLVLEYAYDIYKGYDNCFLDMEIPDANISVGNEFSLIRSNMFKKLWKCFSEQDKEDVRDKIVILTTFAHAHLYKTIIS
jgi:hypothetical protein